MPEDAAPATDPAAEPAAQPVAEPAAEPVAGPLVTLLRVQDLDTAISQLQHRRAALPERQALSGVDAALRATTVRLAEVTATREELGRRQAELERQIAATTSRREALEERLYGSRGSAARDLQAMDEEIRHLRQRRSQLEDAELEVMVEAEPVDAELASLTDERARLLAEASALREAIGAAESEIDAELAVETEAREAAVAGVPAELVQRYEALRARLGGTGAARLVGSRCSGCHLELPSMEVERIRRLPAGTVVTCEQCGRILVPDPARPR